MGFPNRGVPPHRRPFSFFTHSVQSISFGGLGGGLDVCRRTTTTCSTVGHCFSASSTIGFQTDDLAAVESHIGRDDQSGFGIIDAAGQGRSAEAGIHDAVNDADAGTGQHGDDLFGNFRQVDRHAVAFLEAKLLQCVGAAIDLAVELRHM